MRDAIRGNNINVLGKNLNLTGISFYRPRNPKGESIGGGWGRIYDRHVHIQLSVKLK